MHFYERSHHAAHIGHEQYLSGEPVTRSVSIFTYMSWSCVGPVLVRQRGTELGRLCVSVCVGQVHGRVRQHGTDVHSTDDREARTQPARVPAATAEGRCHYIDCLEHVYQRLYLVSMEDHSDQRYPVDSTSCHPIGDYGQASQVVARAAGVAAAAAYHGEAAQLHRGREDPQDRRQARDQGEATHGAGTGHPLRAQGGTTRKGAAYT